MPGAGRGVNGRTGKRSAVIHEDRRSISLWSLLVFVNVSGTVAAVELYGEEFHFWQDPFSARGGRYTIHGTDNPAGMIAMMATMLLSGLVLLSLYRVERHVDDELPRFMRVLLLVGGIGYLIAAVPYDAVLFVIREPAKQGVQKAAFLMLLFTLMTAVFAEWRVSLAGRGRAGEGESVAEAREVDYSDGTED